MRASQMDGKLRTACISDTRQRGFTYREQRGRLHREQRGGFIWTHAPSVWTIANKPGGRIERLASRTGLSEVEAPQTAEDAGRRHDGIGGRRLARTAFSGRAAATSSAVGTGTPGI